MFGKISLRGATREDYRHFIRLFPELGVDDPIFSEEKFTSEMAPTTKLAERDGAVVGYIHWRILGEACHLSHVVVGPEARRTGVGRLLFAEVVDIAKKAGCKILQLNVKPDNVAAITLYESFGLQRVHVNTSLKMSWAKAAAPGSSEPIAPEEDRALEDAFDLAAGTLADRRKLPNRVLKKIGSKALGVFDPTFPGIHPLRARSGADALAVIAAMRPHALPEHDHVNIMVEGDIDLARALVDGGAVVRLETLFMRGSV